MATATARRFAIVTGASSGIGFELARIAAEDGFDLLIAADRDLDDAAARLRALGAAVETVEADLATPGGVDELVAAAAGRPVDALFANAGHGLGGAFLDQSFEEMRHVIDTNVTGTVYLLHRILKDMVARNAGRVLVTGSIAGYVPGSFQAVYHATKAFADSFVWAVQNELKDSDVTLTLLMPGATDTEFFVRAHMQDTKVGRMKKDDPAKVAQVGYDAMAKGRIDVVYGLKNKLQTTFASIAPANVSAAMARSQNEPGRPKPPMSARRKGALAVGGIALAAGAAALLSGGKRQTGTRQVRH